MFVNHLKNSLESQFSHQTIENWLFVNENILEFDLDCYTRSASNAPDNPYLSFPPKCFCTLGANEDIFKKSSCPVI